jgi:hypothetical protein
MARESKSGFSRPWAAFFAAVIILGGMAISLGFGVRLRAALERNAQQRMTTSSLAVQTQVTNDLGRYTDAVRLSAAALSALPQPTAAAFSEIASAVAAQELTAVKAMSFLVPGTPGMTALWRSRGATGFTPKPGGSGLQLHLYTVFAYGLSGGKAPPAGVDQGAAQAVVDVTKLARTSKDVAVSDAYVRLADKSLAQQPMTFEVVTPVLAAKSQVAGYVVLSIGANEFVNTNLSRAAGTLLDAQLLTRSGSGDLAIVATVARGDGTGFRRTNNFTAGGRQWVLRTSATYQSLLPTAGRTDMVVVIAGSALAFMFGTLMYLQLSSSQRAEQEIEAEVEERLASYDEQGERVRLRGVLAAQEALLAGMLTHPGAIGEVDLAAMVDEVVRAGLPAAGDDPETAPEITVGELPRVRADATILRHLIDTMLADALSRTPYGERPAISITAGDDQLRIENAGTVLSCPLPGTAERAPA